MKKKAIVIGSGFAGLSAASFMAKAGWQVQVIEKHGMPGGRARKFSAEGFTFDMGPSWYWMPDVFDRYFEAFGKNRSDYYEITRLNPSYRVYWPEKEVNIPADYNELKQLFESLEPGSAGKLEQFMEEAAYKYRVGIQKLVFKPGQSLKEFADWDLAKGLFRLDVFSSMKNHVYKYFRHPWLRELMEFPVLFLGALPENTPALYSLMNYADMKLGTWYPQNGMYSVVQAMHDLATELGVQFEFNRNVTGMTISENQAKEVQAVDGTGNVHRYQADVVIGGADYHFLEKTLLPPELRNYSEKYWESRVMAPSCLIYYVGLNKKLENIEHHSLFFDVPFSRHAEEIYTTKKWPDEPLFYVSATSVTDPGAAPEGCENLFFLIPVATGLSNDDEPRREAYFEKILRRMEKRTGQNIRDAIVYKRSFAHSDFVEDYNAFKGNAYGLANTLKQTAILKPACRNKKIGNLFYTGQLTVPGPGVPPSLISGEVVAGEVIKHYS